MAIEIDTLRNRSISAERLARMISFRDLVILCFIWFYVHIRRFSDDDIVDRM